MSSRPYRRHDVSVLHRSERLPDIPGDQKVRAAFDAKDPEALRVALHEYPGAWRTDLARLDSSNNVRYDGPCAHFAIKMGWAAALPALKEAGDPLDALHPSSGYTVLQQAVRSAKPATVRKLLRLGVAANQEGDAYPLRALLGSTAKQRIQFDIADALLKAGADPWGMVETDRCMLTMPVAALQWGNVELASYLAQHGKAPILPDDGSLMEAWKRGLKNHTSAYKHLCLFDALDGQGVAPGMEELASLLPTAARHVSTYNPNGQSEAEVVVALMERRFQAGTPAAELRQVEPLLALEAGASQLLADIQQALLDETAPRTEKARRSPRF